MTMQQIRALEEAKICKAVAAAAAFPLVLLVFVGAHRCMAAEGADQWERAAYIVWSGQCDRAEVLCKKTALEYIDRMPKCDTDTDCMAKFGGDGGPESNKGVNE